MSSQPFKVKAVFEYTSPHDEDLNFPLAQIITVTEDDEEDWYTGEYVDASGEKKEGIFPRNFVEKYEPTAPPRPTRAPRPKKEPEAAAATSAVEPPAPKEPYQPLAAEDEPEHDTDAPVPQASPPAPKPAPVVASPPVEVPSVASQPPPKPVPSASKPAPPPVSDKPSGGSFRDRIAAFNKPAAPPVAPFKPGGMGGQSFIKKPFVAPPPSKNSYVPPPREPVPQKIYRRDEDPEIAAKEAENQENAEKAGLAPTTNEGDGEDQPKPTSLKERIALLQKQQAEQASRHADAAAKKEKPKRPAKKRTESHNTIEGREEDEGADLERAESHDTIGKRSLESTREEQPPHRGVPPRRKSSKGPSAAPHETFGDGNDADMSGAGDETEEPEEASTGRDDSDDKPRARAPAVPARAPNAPLHEPDVGEEEGAAEEEEPEEEEEEEEEEDDIDPEVRRKEELRARMAKMSGGMGMHGMFGGGMPMPSALPPKKKKSSGTSERKESGDYGSEDVSSPAAGAPPVPGIPMPGMSRMVRSPEESNKQLEAQEEDEPPRSPVTTYRPSHEMPDIENVKPTPPSRSNTNRLSSGPPPVPGGRPAPPPVPTDPRPTIARAPTQPMSPSAGSESDDELSSTGQKLSLQTPTAEMPNRGLPTRPPQGAPSVPARPDAPSSPRSPTSKRASYFGNEPSPTSPSTPGTSNKRASRLPPPIPGAASSSQGRAPPPPPPNAPSLSRSSTGDARVLTSTQHTEQDESDDEEVTEYEGDYDTDIASAAPHKDALKSHTRDLSLEDDTPVRSPVISPLNAPPPLPPVSAPRAVPPLPSQPPHNNRQSVDMPRGVPPPPPPPKEQAYDGGDDDEYDPYRYNAPQHGIPMPIPPTRRVEEDYDEEDIYSVSPPRSKPPPVQERAAPPPPPRDVAPPPASRAAPRQSMDFQKNQGQSLGRRSTDLARMSMESGFVANDVDLAAGTMWWTNPDGVPPVFQNRKDILYESEESTSTKRGGKSTTTKDLYVLFQDYSQTIITVLFDPHNPIDASLEQRHEQPPARQRQDQLESAHEDFGRQIAAAVASKKDTVVGDGTPQALVQELLKPLSGALLPVGTRAYGALVYANMGNANTALNDEIRPGDIITLRNARFQGKHGPMHAKYNAEVGNASTGTGHVGVVAEWDGTKKKVRAWEQGREKKKVGLESFKLDDLRSGEVKIWRVMPRGWVHWEGQN